MLHFDSKYLRIYWEEVPNHVRTEWHGFVHNDDFKEGLKRALELAREKKTRLWLGDLTDLKVLTQDDKQWIIEKWIPLLVELKIKKVAFVKPKNPVTLLTIQNVLKTTQAPPIPVKFFDDVPQAVTWLAANPTALV